MLVPLLVALSAFAGDPTDPFGPRGPGAAPTHGELELVDPFAWKVVPPVLVGEEPAELELRLQLPDGFQMYRDRVRVTVVDAGTLNVGSPTLPPGRWVDVVDPEHPRQLVLEGAVAIELLVSATELTEPGLAVVKLLVEHQGCFSGRCLPPERRDVTALVPVRSPDAEPSTCPLAHD
jgi:thiol:disulfide interchange protein